MAQPEALLSVWPVGLGLVKDTQGGSDVLALLKIDKSLGEHSFMLFECATGVLRVVLCFAVDAETDLGE